MSDEEDNLIQFPVDRIVRRNEITLPTAIDLNVIHHAYIFDVVEAIMGTVSMQLQAAGFKIGLDSSLAEGAFFVETLHSLLCKQYGINHPFQKLADATFTQEADGNLRLNDKIEVKFTELEKEDES